MKNDEESDLCELGEIIKLYAAYEHGLLTEEE